jgi:hypothetical protein
VTFAAKFFAARKTVSSNQSAHAECRQDESARTGYAESTPCMVMPVIDQSELIPARFRTPRTIVDYLT